MEARKRHWEATKALEEPLKAHGIQLIKAPGKQMIKALGSSVPLLKIFESWETEKQFLVPRRETFIYDILPVWTKIMDYVLGAENVCIFALGAEAAFY